MKNGDQEIRTQAPDGRPAHQQPPWRQDFPIDVPQDNFVARRDFTKFMGLTSLAFVVGQFWILLQSWFRSRKEKPQRKVIARLNDLPAGTAKIFTYPNENDSCILLRTRTARAGEEGGVALPDGSSLVAYNQECTHLSCAVVPDLDQSCLFCPCHRGFFDLATGRPSAGPPRRPLPRIHLELVDDVIYATAVELRST